MNIIDIFNVYFLSLGIETIDKNLFKPIENCLYKPMYGLWSSVYTSNKICKSEWHRWCLLSDWDIGLDTKGVVFTLKKSAKILVIDSKKDYEKIKEIYPLEIDMFFHKQNINFIEVAKDYDGIFLTNKGQRETYFELYGWDCESLVLFNLECIDKSEKITFEDEEIYLGASL